MNKSGIKVVLGVVFLVIGVVDVTANAEERDPGVLNRDRADYDAVGLPAGGFIVFPSVGVAIGSDDNLFATDTLEVDDAFGSFNLEIVAQSNWSRHELILDAYGQATKFDENSDENQTIWGLGLKGQIEARSSIAINADGHFDRLSEARDSIDAIGLAAEPVLYDMATGSLSFSQRLNRLSFSLGGRYTAFDYDDLKSSGGGLIDQDFRDRDVSVAMVTAKYEFSPAYVAIIQGEVNSRDYDLESSDAAFVPGVNSDRDSTGFKVEGGFEFGLTNLVDGNVMVGYLKQDYDDVSFMEVDGASFSVGLRWRLTGLTDLRMDAGRSAEDTTSSLVGGRMATTYGVAIDHELRRNVIVTIEASQTNYDFEDSLRDDDILRAGSRIRYLVNRWISFGLQYDYVDRSSNIVGVDHARNMLQLNYKAQL